MWTTQKTVDRAERTTSAYATGVAAVAVTLVLVSLAAAAAFELHNIPGMGGAGLIILSKKWENWNWGPERSSELPKVTQQKAWMVLIAV